LWLKAGAPGLLGAEVQEQVW